MMTGKPMAVLNTVVNLLRTDPASPELAVIKRHRSDWGGADDEFPAAFIYFDRTTYRKYGPARKVADYEIKLVLSARHENSFEQADGELEKLLDDGFGKGMEVLFERPLNVQIENEHYWLELGEEINWDQVSDGQQYISICEMVIKVVNRLGGRSG